jgi:hypothetical protein
MKAQPTRLALGEHPVEHQRVEVDVQVEAAAEALDDDEAPGVPVPDPAPARLPALEIQQRPRVDAQHGVTEGVGSRRLGSAGGAVGSGPTAAQGPPGQHLIHQAGGALGHTPVVAARAEAATLARKRHQPLEGTGATADTGKAVGQDPASEEVAELLLYEVWQADALGAMRRLPEEGLEGVADEPTSGEVSETGVQTT